MIQAYRDADADLSILREKRIAVLGYGSQGRAQALNLRDSGLDVRVGTREEGDSFTRAGEDGFSVSSVSGAAKVAEVLVFCLPDVEMGRIFREDVEPYLLQGSALVFSHGFAIQYGLIQTREDLDVILVAPMGAGPVVRSRFEQGSGVPGMIAVASNASGRAWDLAKAYGSAIGCGRVAMLETTFREETESDLFGEQAVLCGGVPSLMMASYETLVAGGVRPEIAYIACVHEVKLIADLIYERGLDGMVESISQTAEWGAYQAQPNVCPAEVKKGLEQIWQGVRSGDFAKQWVAEEAKGSAALLQRRKAFLANSIHEVGTRIRELFGIAKS